MSLRFLQDSGDQGAVGISRFPVKQIERRAVGERFDGKQRPPVFLRNGFKTIKPKGICSVFSCGRNSETGISFAVVELGVFAVVGAQQVGTVEAASRRQRRKHERAVAAALQVSGQALHFTIGMAFAVRKKTRFFSATKGASSIARSRNSTG